MKNNLKLFSKSKKIKKIRSRRGNKRKKTRKNISKSSKKFKKSLRKMNRKLKRKNTRKTKRRRKHNGKKRKNRHNRKKRRKSIKRMKKKRRKTRKLSGGGDADKLQEVTIYDDNSATNELQHVKNGAEFTGSVVKDQKTCDHEHCDDSVYDAVTVTNDLFNSHTNRVYEKEIFETILKKLREIMVKEEIKKLDLEIFKLPANDENNKIRNEKTDVKVNLFRSLNDESKKILPHFTSHQDKSELEIIDEEEVEQWDDLNPKIKKYAVKDGDDKTIVITVQEREYIFKFNDKTMKLQTYHVDYKQNEYYVIRHKESDAIKEFCLKIQKEASVAGNKLKKLLKKHAWKTRAAIRLKNAALATKTKMEAFEAAAGEILKETEKQEMESYNNQLEEILKIDKENLQENDFFETKIEFDSIKKNNKELLKQKSIENNKLIEDIVKKYNNLLQSLLTKIQGEIFKSTLLVNNKNNIEKKKQELIDAFNDSITENINLKDEFKRKHEEYKKMLDNLDYDKLIAANVVLKLLNQELTNEDKAASKIMQGAIEARRIARLASQAKENNKENVINPG